MGAPEPPRALAADAGTPRPAEDDSGAGTRAARVRALVLQMLVDEGDRHAPLADGFRSPLHRGKTAVAAHEVSSRSSSEQPSKQTTPFRGPGEDVVRGAQHCFNQSLSCGLRLGLASFALATLATLGPTSLVGASDAAPRRVVACTGPPEILVFVHQRFVQGAAGPISALFGGVVDAKGGGGGIGITSLFGGGPGILRDATGVFSFSGWGGGTSWQSVGNYYDYTLTVTTDCGSVQQTLAILWPASAPPPPDTPDPPPVVPGTPTPPITPPVTPPIAPPVTPPLTPPVTPPVAPSPVNLPARWARDGRKERPLSQVAADKAAMPAGCGRNAALLLRVRGSGEKYGADDLGAWTFSAGTVLIRNGWQVRDMQAMYSAPDVPPITPAGVASLKGYRDVATREWAAVRDQIEGAYRRCQQRLILISGYSQGGLILRYVIRNLSEDARERVAGVYLVADPTADRNVDQRLQHPAGISGKLTDQGIDTYAGRVLWTGNLFRQKPYPPDIQGRVFQICGVADLVCNFSSKNSLSASRRRASTQIHTSYPMAAYGVHGANRLISYSANFTR